MTLNRNTNYKLLSDNRFLRLRILTCFYEYSSLFMDGQPRRKFTDDEISLVCSWTSFQDAIEWMISEKIVSTEYTYKHFQVDLWYITKEYSPKYGKKSIETGGVGTEKLMLHIVIQALLDVYSKRPCDKSLWISDLSPDALSCTSNAHICAEHAEKFLAGLDPVFESFIGVSNGCVYELLFQIKKSQQFVGIC